MIWGVLYVAGVLLTLMYCYKNLDREQIGVYFEPAAVIASLVWPMILAVCGVVACAQLFDEKFR